MVSSTSVPCVVTVPRNSTGSASDEVVMLLPPVSVPALNTVYVPSALVSEVTVAAILAPLAKLAVSATSLELVPVAPST